MERLRFDSNGRIVAVDNAKLDIFTNGKKGNGYWNGNGEDEDENGYDFSGQAAQHDDGDEYAVKLNMFRHTLFIRLLADDSITWLRWLKRKPMPLLINGAEVNDDILTPVIYDSSSDEVRNEL